MTTAIDHIVIAAADLDQADAWARERLGVATLAGGRHDFMGTHNRLLRLDGADGADGRGAYLEFIAVDPHAPAPARPRWFGLDDAAQRERLRTGPRLLHWVARVSGLDHRRAAAAALALDPGEPTPAARGALRWRLTLRPAGDLLLGGAWPTLIEWQGAHPTDTMPHSAIALRELRLRGLPPPARALLGEVPGVAFTSEDGAPALELVLRTPRGEIGLASAPHPGPTDERKP